MTDIEMPVPSQDERIMAALSHVSALLPMMGIIAPIVIWVTQREKSKYVAFQSLQALAYQLVMILAWFIGMGCYMFSFFGTFITIPFSAPSPDSQTVSPIFGLLFMVPFLVFGSIFVGGFLMVAYGFFAAIRTLQGRPFRYAIVGNRVARFIADQPSTPSES